MRFFVIAADVALGAFLGIFVYAALFTIWPPLRNILVALPIVAACIVIVLFRRPNGALAKPRDRGPSG